MKRLALAFIISAFTVGSAAAQSCATKAMSKDGKPLTGAANTSSIIKRCEHASVIPDGKPLARAAMASFVQKCARST